ncbi:hypothetical protein C8Q77DRAFT_1235176 [Trametes polyzona]|nr:hypothetical protein C8Q77DRAFT_1235176 [Trametes polyzona]
MLFTSIFSGTAHSEDTAKKALLSVVQVWLDRLQAMAVVTTFFVTIDSMLYGYACPPSPSETFVWSNTDLVKGTTLGGAIILHVCASILAYLASFVMIRYRLEDAEERAEDTEHPSTRTTARIHAEHNLRTKYQAAIAPPIDSTSGMHPVRTKSPDLLSMVVVYQVKPFDWVHRTTNTQFVSTMAAEAAQAGDPSALQTLESMVQTLTQCHTVVAVMSNVGFALALVGTIVYFSTALPVALGIFAGACLGVCLLAGVYAVIRPSADGEIVSWEMDLGLSSAIPRTTLPRLNLCQNTE